jgi:hypothetical protein
MALQEFRNIAPQVRWIFGGVEPDNIQSDGNPGGHGTCMMDKVLGDRYGIAKRLTSPIVVKLEGIKDRADFLDCVSKTVDDFIFNRTPGEKAVVNMSVFFPDVVVSSGWIDRLRFLLQNMVTVGMFVVVPAGNYPSVSLPLPQHSLSFLTGSLGIACWVSSRIRQS